MIDDDKGRRFLDPLDKLEEMREAYLDAGVSHVMERKRDRMAAGLSPEFTVYLTPEAAPKAYAYGVSKVVGCPVVWL